MLVGALNNANTTVTRLQQCLDDQGVDESVMEQRKNDEIEALIRERSELRNNAAAIARRLEKQREELLAFENEKTALVRQIEQLRSSCEQLKIEAESANRETAEVAESKSK